MLPRSCFSVTIASRFKIVDEEYIEELNDKSENKNTKNSSEYWENAFKKWANERNFQVNLEEYESDCPRQSTVKDLCIQKLSNFAFYVINKKS